MKTLELYEELLKRLENENRKLKQIIYLAEFPPHSPDCLALSSGQAVDCDCEIKNIMISGEDGNLIEKL